MKLKKIATYIVAAALICGSAVSASAEDLGSYTSNTQVWPDDVNFVVDLEAAGVTADERANVAEIETTVEMEDGCSRVLFYLSTTDELTQKIHKRPIN